MTAGNLIFAGVLTAALALGAYGLGLTPALLGGQNDLLLEFFAQRPGLGRADHLGEAALEFV